MAFEAGLVIAFGIPSPGTLSRCRYSASADYMPINANNGTRGHTCEICAVLGLVSSPYW